MAIRVFIMAIQTDITERPSRKLNEFDTLSNTLSTEANLNMERTPVNKTPSEEPSIDEWVFLFL